MSDQRGVLGKLPRTRPNVESPRRVAAREQPGDGERGTAPAADAGLESDPPISGFRQLARAGFGLAGGAAAAGLRLAERTAGEIGKAVARR
jgi:hypothetical protein